MRVDFVIGGTQKGGTSALDSFLRQHPEICMPETRKELHFFDREADDTDYKKYHANFKPKPEHRVIGEGNPSVAAKRCRYSTECIPTSTAAFTRIRSGGCSTFSGETIVSCS